VLVKWGRTGKKSVSSFLCHLEILSAKPVSNRHQNICLVENPKIRSQIQKRKKEYE